MNLNDFFAAVSFIHKCFCYVFSALSMAQVKCCFKRQPTLQKTAISELDSRLSFCCYIECPFIHTYLYTHIYLIVSTFWLSHKSINALRFFFHSPFYRVCLIYINVCFFFVFKNAIANSMEIYAIKMWQKQQDTQNS